MTSGDLPRGARIQAIRSGRRDEVLLDTYEPSLRLRRWELSADAEDARWLEVFFEPESPADAGAGDLGAGAAKRSRHSGDTPFVLLLRARLEGGHVRDFGRLAQGGVQLDVVTGQGNFVLLLQLDSRRSHLLLLDAAGVVLGKLPAPQEDKTSLTPGEFAAGSPYVPVSHPRSFAPGLERVPPASRDAARALARHWAERLAEHDLVRTRAELGKALRLSAKRLERRLAHLAQDREAAGLAERYRTWGELLKIHGARAFHGRPVPQEVRVPDEFAEGRPEVTIPLDPEKNLAENIAHLFRQYRKRLDAQGHVVRRLAETQRDLAAVHAAEEGLATAASLDRMQTLARQALGKSALRPETTASGMKSNRSTRGSHSEVSRLLERTSSDGLTILVGRSAADNDTLTFRIAKGRDWWLHASGFPGSHVVVRNPAGGPLPQSSLREAAWLAAYYSKARNQGQVEVVYVERKHVRRPPKALPGQVTLAHGKTLWVDVSDARLKQVLNAGGDQAAE